MICFLQVGEIVELDLVRGYPLPFDPADPSVKKVGTYKIVNAEDIQRSPSSTSLGPSNGNNTVNRNQRPEKANSGYNSDGEGFKKENRLGGNNVSSIILYHCNYACYGVTTWKNL